MKMTNKKIIVLGIISLLAMLLLNGCGFNKEQILIYSCAEDYRNEYLQERLEEEFPEYEIIIEYISTGNAAAKLQMEGKNSECDIIYDLEYGYMEMLDEDGIFADLSDYDRSIYVEDTVLSDNFIVASRSSGAIIVNKELLKEKGIEVPTSYEDLLKPEYKGLISMPNPKSSSTGYMFLKSLINTWGEEEAFQYFDQLTPNILQYTTSGSGPLNALLQGEVAIGLGMTAPTVTEINEGAPLEIIFFEEGVPYLLSGQAIISGKENEEGVAEVFRFLVEEFTYEHTEKFFPEKIYKEVDFSIEHYPQNMDYSDMSNNSSKEKERILGLWKY